MNSQPGDTLPQIKAVLDASGLAYEVWPCDDTLADTASFCAHYNVPPSHSVNAILVRSKSDPAQMALCMVPATHRLDVNRTVRKRLGAKKASFATPEDTRALPSRGDPSLLRRGDGARAADPDLPCKGAWCRSGYLHACL
jgi:hypothetical protein